MLKIFKYDTLDDFLAALGYGGVSIGAHRRRGSRRSSTRTRAGAAAGAEAPRAARRSHTVQVLGTGDLLTQIARCCNPVPGDQILGYVTRSRGVTVHRADCYNVLHEDEQERLVDVEWGRTRRDVPGRRAHRGVGPRRAAARRLDDRRPTRR